MALLELVNLGKRFESGYQLKNITLSVDSGEVFALIGPTGSGKTTLLRLIDLIDFPPEGHVCFDGKNVTHSKSERLKARRRMAYVQQKPAVFSMNVFENVAVGLKWRRVSRNDIRERVMHALEMMEMSEYIKRDARTLSGGETQRVAIARALVTEPELLLLDEPTANLDPVSVEKIEEVLENIIRTGKTTIIVSTHDREQGQKLATKMGVLIDGELLQVGTPADVFRSPSRKRVADFVGVGNLLPGTVTERIDENLTIVQVAGVTIQAISDLDIGTTVWAIVRTEDVVFSLEHVSTSARNSFTGPITKMTPVGTLIRLEIDCGFPLVGVVTAKTVSEMGLKLGTILFASFKATAVHIINRRS